jgi:hypothetical protein
VRPRAGLSCSLLAVSDGKQIAPIPIEGLPDRCEAREVIQIALALSGGGREGGDSPVLLAGEEWARRLGDRTAAPLVPMESARMRLEKRGGSR